MLDKQTVAYLRYVHGLYNIIVFLLIICQARMGLKIRRLRKKNSADPATTRRHRKAGPVLAAMGIAGFFAGLTIIYLDTGRIGKYPVHLFNGSAIAMSLAAAFVVSRMIKGPASPWRTPHFVLGVIILCLYAFQVFLGLGILL